MAAVDVALGLAVRRVDGALLGAFVTGPASSPRVARVTTGAATPAAHRRPHTELRLASPAALEAGVAEARRELERLALAEVRSITAPPTSGEPVAVGVLVPRWRRVEDLRERVGRPEHARRADEHLLAGAVVDAARTLGLPVAEVSAADALHEIEGRFGLDRRALGEQAARVDVADFAYHHRLAVLAARVVLARLEP